jgi:succinate dehydrogenase / fumarate reductase iron-sulfur subunit
MHPLDTLDRRELVKDAFKIGYCNITKCCSEVCPEHIHITDNGIIPLKERVADDYFDPIRWAIDKVSGRPKKERVKLPIATAETPPLPAAQSTPGTEPR